MRENARRGEAAYKLRALACVVSTPTGGTAVSAVCEKLDRQIPSELAVSSDDSAPHGRDARATGKDRDRAALARLFKSVKSAQSVDPSPLFFVLFVSFADNLFLSPAAL
jgi:hypothetical protein